MDKKLSMSLFFLFIVLILDVFLVVTPTFSRIVSDIRVSRLNKVSVGEAVEGVGLDLPNIKSTLQVTYDTGTVEATSELESNNVFHNKPNSDGDTLSYNSLEFIDFRTFLDSLLYGEPENKSWDNWNKDEYYIHSYIIEVKENSLVLSIIYPEDKSFTGIWKTVSAECTRENSVLVSSENFELVATNIDIFFESKEGDGFFTYCLDNNCDTVGKSCVVVRGEKNE